MSRYTFEDYEKYYTNCKNWLFGGGCSQYCAMRENGCCELSYSEMGRLSLQKMGINVPDDLSPNEFPVELFKMAQAGITVNAQKQRKALVSGSFDPFTVGHLAIVQQASEMFDEVHVVIFKNSSKKRMFDAVDMVAAIDADLKKAGINNAIVKLGSGLLAEYCEQNGILHNVRGLRNSGDYEYEEQMIYANTEIFPELKTIYLTGGNNKTSSTLVREFLNYGKDVRKYVPENVYNLILNDYVKAN